MRLIFSLSKSNRTLLVEEGRKRKKGMKRGKENMNE